MQKQVMPPDLPEGAPRGFQAGVSAASGAVTDARGVWVINPANGHAYKRIPCESRDDAVAQAAEEKAHLVTINDAAEQAWLTAVFGHEFYWIGLSDTETEGQWQWDNGEPLTYTNWGPKHSFPRSTLSPEEMDSAVMTFVNGQWHTVGPGDLLWRSTKLAILEKELQRTGETTQSD